MAPITITLTVVGFGCIFVGIQALIRGRRVSSESGPNTLMHFPTPLPWLRNKVTAARWVAWGGRLYLVAGITCLMGAWLILQNPSETATNQHCAQFSEAIFSTFPQVLQGGHANHSPPAKTCATRVFDNQNVRWFVILSSAAKYAPKHDFLEERRSLSRLAYTIEPVEGLGIRAALAKPKPGSNLNPVLIFNTSQGQHRIEANTRLVGTPQMNRLIDALRKTLRTYPAQSL